MEIVKKNLLSIICGVVALVAIVAYFVVVTGTKSSIESGLEQRASLYTSLEGLISKPRKSPVVDPFNPSQEDLAVFPSEPIIRQGEKVQEDISKQAAQVIQTAIAINRHEPLVKEALTSRRVPDQFRFRDAYVRKMYLRREQPAAEDSLQVGILHADLPPTQELLKQKADELWNKKYKDQIQVFGNNQTNEAALKAAWTEEANQLPETLKNQIAQTAKVYMMPDALDYSRTINIEQAPQPVDIWYAQLGLWVQEDVCKAIARANESSKNVTEAPIKRLFRIEQPKDYVFSGQSSSAGGRPGDPRGGGTVGGSGLASAPPGDRNPSASATGRVSNSLYDVVHFKVMLDVESARLPAVLTELTRNQFIYILNMTVEPVDSVSEALAGFLYGDKPVVRINLDCEQIFLRAWTTELMPEEIKAKLGVQTAAAAGASAGVQ